MANNSCGWLKSCSTTRYNRLLLPTHRFGELEMTADPELIVAIARTLYAGYMKDTTGVPGKWADLDEGGRDIWRNMAKRGIRRIDELRSSKTKS
jgi:hypothetical protein